MSGLPVRLFDHLDRLSDQRGIFEHALYTSPRIEHGYCVDDAGRALVVVCREPGPSRSVCRLARCYLDFVLDALESDGRCHNRMDGRGEWQDAPGSGDWWGRAMWGLGVAAGTAIAAGMRARALNGFRIGAQQRSPHRRAMAFAALGAAELLGARPAEGSARALLADAGRAISPGDRDVSWPWPEPRLTYGNAALAEAVIAAGGALHDAAGLAHGLALLEFLLNTEIRDGHLSVTPVGGRGPGEDGPGFDQQPIEVAALADACATAYRFTGNTRWLTGVSLAWNWFLGDNDSATPMFDPSTGAGFDGLQADGCNRNQGAESTLAMLSTAQQATRLLGRS